MTIIAEFTIKVDELGIESFRKPLVIKPAIGFKCKGLQCQYIRGMKIGHEDLETET